MEDVMLPSSPVIPEVLNAPCPPHFNRSKIDRFGDGMDAINVRCNSETEVINFYVPTADEILEELLLEHNFEIAHDEKRSSYLPTIDRFGSLYQAAEAFSGTSGRILAVLARTDREIDAQQGCRPDDATGVQQGSFTPAQLRGICKLGAGPISGSDYLSTLDRAFSIYSKRTKRIAKKRYESLAQFRVPEGVTLEALLEHWSDRSLLSRRWRLGYVSKLVFHGE